MNNNIKVIAFYLPQFHPVKENDEWWGKGFTEWTNVGKAKPLFKGHYQPRIPADLGYYDLRLPSVREEQANLAKEAGVFGFCYWHYWFGNGKRLLEQVFDEVLDSGKPDFPFCLGWANHSWYAKDWNSDGARIDKLLIEQKYPGYEDIRAHFDYVLDAFKDNRYIKINNKPFFYIYDLLAIPPEFTSLWNKWAIENGFDGIHFVARKAKISFQNNELLSRGINSLTVERMTSYFYSKSKIKTYIHNFHNQILGRPKLTANYKDALPFFIDLKEDKEEYMYPSIIPNWDHSPRSSKGGSILHNSTPFLFKIHAKEVFTLVKEKKEENRIVFLKSWNEWGEGNHLEPDLKFGKQYIEALREALNES